MHKCIVILCICINVIFSSVFFFSLLFFVKSYWSLRFLYPDLRVDMTNILHMYMGFINIQRENENIFAKGKPLHHYGDSTLFSNEYWSKKNLNSV